MHIRTLFLAAITVSFSSAAVAAAVPVSPTGTVIDASMPAPLASVVKLGRLEVKKSFHVAPDMTGYLIDQEGRQSVVYGVHGYLLVGALIAPDGRNLTAVYRARFVPPPDYTATAHALAAHGHLITAGPSDAPVLRVFEDPNCIFCEKLNRQLLPLVAKGKIRLEVALVGFLKPDSLGRATAILAAKDPFTALQDNVAKFRDTQEEGGYPAQAEPDPQLAAVVSANMDLMRQAGFHGTPSVLYRTAKGKWAAIPGMPSPAQLARLIRHGDGK